MYKKKNKKTTIKKTNNASENLKNNCVLEYTNSKIQKCIRSYKLDQLYNMLK